MKFLVPIIQLPPEPLNRGATASRSPFSLSSVLNWICWTLPEQNSWVSHWFQETNPDKLLLFCRKSPQTNPLQVRQRGPYGEKYYCLCQRLQCNWSGWNVISQERATVWRQQSGFVSSQQSGQIRAAMCIGFECCCNGLTATYRCSYKSGQTCRIKCNRTCLAMYAQTNVGLLCCVGADSNVAAA